MSKIQPDMFDDRYNEEDLKKAYRHGFWTGLPVGMVVMFGILWFIGELLHIN